MSESKIRREKIDILRERLSTVRVSARKDLSVSRHLFRGKVSYIVHDPISMFSHRLSQHDYHILSALNREENLADTFAEMVKENFTSVEDEQPFYEFVLNLQTKGLLDLPITDSSLLYERHVKMKEMQNKNLVNKILFLKVPLMNPNDFLDRTLHFAKPLFTRWFFAIWLLLMFTSSALLISRWDEFFVPFADLLATRNLLIFLIVMTALKFWHELGHAYACKISGGAVPDMGAFFMVGMPMAYVDVSSSWSFPSRNSRMLVGLGGMYFESIAAAISVFIWATTPDGIVNSAAHFTFLMASVMTVLFNANPLMRYDGYYILSDLLGIPNLRQRSQHYLKERFKSAALGLPVARNQLSTAERITLFNYGIAAFLYQITLTLSICLMLATQYFLIGIAMGSAFIATAIFKPAFNFFRYLFSSPETEIVRRRSISWGVGIVAVPLALMFLVPIPAGIVANGQLGFENMQIVRLPVDCQIESIFVEPNQTVKKGESLLNLRNEDVSDRFILAAAELNIAKTALMASTNKSAVEHRRNFFTYEDQQQKLEDSKSSLQELSVTAEIDGYVLSCPRSNQIDKYCPVGMELARIGSGRRIIRCLLNSEQFSSINLKLEDRVVARLYAGGSCNHSAFVSRIEPGGSRKIGMAGLTHLGAGNIIVNPLTGESDQSYFLVEVTLDETIAPSIPEKTTASVRFGRKFETVGSLVYRRINILINRLRSGS